MQSILRNPFATPLRRWGLSVATAAVVLAFLVLVPFSYEHTVGTKLTITSSDPSFGAIDTEALRAQIAAHGMPAVTFQLSTGTDGHTLRYYVQGSQSDALAAFEATRDVLPQLDNATVVSLTPWRVKESGSLLAQIGARVFEATVSTTGKTDAEIAAEIRQQLESQGMSVDKMTVTRNDDGTTKLEISGSADGSDGSERQFQIKRITKGGDPDEDMSVSITFDDLPEGLSDAELKAEIEQRLAERGVTDMQVTVHNGEVRVEIEKRIE